MTSFPQHLITALKEKKLIPFVAAGVSRSVIDKEGNRIFPSWEELLNNAAEQLNKDDADYIKQSVKKGRLLRAAQDAKDELKGKLWFDFLKTQFNPDLSECPPSSFDLPKAIWRLGNQIITLNYDRVMTHCAEGSNAQKVTNEEQATLNQMSNVSDDKMVWYLHGHIDAPAKIILTPEGYKRLYEQDDDYEAALQTLKHVIASRSFLFIGCSLSDAELIAQMAKQYELFEGNVEVHYALVHKTQFDRMDEKLKDIKNIELIPFEDFGEPLVELINKLAVHKTVTNESDTSTTESKTVEPSDIAHSEKQSKIAYLSASPLDAPVDLKNVETAIKKQLPFDLYPQQLSINKLQQLSDEDFDYLVLACKIRNNKLVIENDWMGAEYIHFSDLEDNLDLDEIKGVILICDKLPSDQSLEGVNVPIIIIPELAEKGKCLGKLWFQLFKKQSFVSFEDTCLLHNVSSFFLGEKLSQLKGKWQPTPVILPKDISKEDVADYIGRKQELETCSRLFHNANNNGECLNIHGTGGLGKTKLVQKLVFEYAKRSYYPNNNIFFINCENLANYDQFYRPVAEAFGLEDALDFIGHIELNPEFINEERLIIIDNAESLLCLDEKAKALKLISDITNYAHVLITSRELLGINTELPYALRDFVSDEAVTLLANKSGREFNDNEQEYLRQYILKPLLDNNPLAISIIAGTLMEGRSLQALHEDLEKNFFELTQRQDEYFTEAEARNVDRKASIWNSIDYSYQALKLHEKEALLKLSYFPDGIDLEGFKKLTEKNAKASGKAPINDATLKSLQRKSLLQTNNKYIRLHPLVAKFAAELADKKGDQDGYLKNIFEYNRTLVSELYDLSLENNLTLKLKAQNLFYGQLRNILLTIKNLNKPYDVNDVSELLIGTSVLVSHVGCHKDFRTTLNELLKKIATTSELYKPLLAMRICEDYYSGSFDNAFNEVQSCFPINEIVKLNSNSISISQRLIIRQAMSIYSNEGMELESAFSKSKNGRTSRYYDNDLQSLGVLDLDYAQAAQPTNVSFSVQFHYLGFDQNDFDKVLTHTHEKDHIMKANLLRLKVKYQPVSEAETNALVVVNPYTQGVKYLLLALQESNHEYAKDLFEKALTQLKHIKFAYVEALLRYAEWLQRNNKLEFDSVVKEGLALAKQYYYRYLQYCFEQLTTEEKQAYDESNYPLPHEEEIKQLVAKNIKFCLRVNK